MKNLILLIVVWSISFGAFAQLDAETRAQLSATEQSDPEAKAILDKVKAKYEGFKTMKVNFTLDIEGEIEDSQKGVVYLNGENYRVEMKNQDIISNGNTVWFHLKNNNEVQINNPDPEGQEGFLSPADMLKVYDQNLLYALREVVTEDGKPVYHIEFKPRENDDESEFFKLRLSVTKGYYDMTKIIAFGRDGTRYTLTFTELETDTNLKDELFTFDPSKFPDIYVEDLREE